MSWDVKSADMKYLATTSDLLNPELFTQLTLDASFYINGCENLEALELHSREYILQIHRKRIANLNRQISEC